MLDIRRRAGTSEKAPTATLNARLVDPDLHEAGRVNALNTNRRAGVRVVHAVPLRLIAAIRAVIARIAVHPVVVVVAERRDASLRGLRQRRASRSGVQRDRIRRRKREGRIIRLDARPRSGAVAPVEDAWMRV